MVQTVSTVPLHKARRISSILLEYCFVKFAQISISKKDEENQIKR